MFLERIYWAQGRSGESFESLNHNTTQFTAALLIMVTFIRQTEELGHLHTWQVMDAKHLYVLRNECIGKGVYNHPN